MSSPVATAERSQSLNGTGALLVRVGILYAVAFLIVSPGLYVDKFAGGLGSGVCLALSAGFGCAALIATGGRLLIAYLWTVLFAALLPNDVSGLRSETVMVVRRFEGDQLELCRHASC